MKLRELLATVESICPHHPALAAEVKGLTTIPMLARFIYWHAERRVDGGEFWRVRSHPVPLQL